MKPRNMIALWLYEWIIVGLFCFWPKFANSFFIHIFSIEVKDKAMYFDYVLDKAIILCFLLFQLHWNSWLVDCLFLYTLTSFLLFLLNISLFFWEQANIYLQNLISITQLNLQQMWSHVLIMACIKLPTTFWQGIFTIFAFSSAIFGESSLFNFIPTSICVIVRLQACI